MSTAVAVKGLVTEAISNSVSARTGVSVSRFAAPVRDRVAEERA
jgi:hypothetical protein